MPVPHLPLDIWFRISTFLDPPSLSSLSKVCHSLYKVSTHLKHFHRLLRHPLAPGQHPMQLFRRFAALHHPPPEFTTAALSKNLVVLVTLREEALLLDLENQSIIAFPSGHTYNLKTIFGVTWRKARHLLFSSLQSRIVSLPGRCMGFVSGNNGSRFSVLDLRSGEVIHHKPRRKRKLSAVLKSKSVAVAGNTAEWVLYRVNGRTIEMIDWRSGDVVKVVNDVGEDVAFVLGVCPELEGVTVVGLVYSRVKDSVREVLVKGFDGVETVFRVEEEKFVHSVLRSEDKLTHVLITANTAQCASPTHFIAHSTRGKICRWWSGDVKNGMQYPELRENGRVIAESRRPFRTRFSCKCIWKWPLWIVLNEDGGTWGSSETVVVERNRLCTPPIWSRRIPNGELVIIVGRHDSIIELLQLTRDRDKIKENLLANWTVENLVSVSVVSDHYVIATGSDRKLHLLHFDKFCKGSGGVYGCPLVGLLTYCYFPDEFRGGDEFVRRNKRRRVEDTVEQTEIKWD